MTIDDIIVEGRSGRPSAIRGTALRKQSFYGIPASGKWVDVTSIGIDRVVNGQVAEGWGELDMVGMMQALGAFPMIGPGAVASGKSSLWGPDSTVTGDSPTSPEENKQILLRFIDAISRGDRQALEQVTNVFCYLEHNPVWGAETLQGGIQVYNQLREAMPDLHFEVEKDIMIAEGQPGGRRTPLSPARTRDRSCSASRQAASSSSGPTAILFAWSMARSSSGGSLLIP